MSAVALAVLGRYGALTGDTYVQDAKGQRLVVGSRIAPATWRGEFYPGGWVTEVSDPDGDVDDEGRSIGINPRVTVVYDDGTEDTYGTTCLATWWDQDPTYECDDLVRQTTTIKEYVL